jgi:putative NADH-flavin reductase
VRVSLFGATGATGRLVLEQLVDRHYEVRALVGDSSKLAGMEKRLTIIEGDAEEYRKVSQAVSGCEAVVDTLGVRANTAAEVERLSAVKGSILRAMLEQGVTRYVGVAGAGVDVPGDEKGTGYKLASWFKRLTSRYVAEQKQKEFELVSRSGLDWTILRVPFITEGPLTKKYSASLLKPPSSRISRADVAYAMVSQIGDREFVRKAPFVAN